MSTDISTITELLGDIQRLSSHILEHGAFRNEAERQELVAAADGLANAARKPPEYLYYTATHTTQLACIRTAIDANVFTSIPDDGSAIELAELSKRSGVAEPLMARLLRALTSTGILASPTRTSYTHTPLSRLYLSPANRSFLILSDSIMRPALNALPAFLSSTRYTTPGSAASNAFMHGHETELNIFDWLSAHPAQQAMFAAGMRALVTAGDLPGEVYPFAQEEAAEEEYGDGEVLIVDVGGGRGQALEGIRRRFPGLKGRWVLQDREAVVAEGVREGLPDYIEAHAASFFEAQRKEFHNAHYYLLRRILHDWSEPEALVILRHLAAAMSQRSRLLIVDNVLPDTGCPRAPALQDINMMTIGGKERTEGEWRGLLGEAGCEIRRIFRVEGVMHAVIEAVKVQ